MATRSRYYLLGLGVAAVVVVVSGGLLLRSDDGSGNPSPGAGLSRSGLWEATSYEVAGAAPNGPALLRFSPTGEAAAVWPSEQQGRSGVMVADGSGPAPGTRIVQQRATDSPLVASGGGVTFVGYDWDAESRRASRLSASSEGPDAPGPPQQALSPGGRKIGNSAMAVSGSGVTALAWIELAAAAAPSESSARLRVAVGTTQSGFGTPATLQTGTASDAGYVENVAVAIGADGLVAVVSDNLDRDGAAAVVWRRPKDEPFGEPVALDFQDRSAKLRAAVTTSGSVVVAAASQASGLDAGSPWTVETATLEQGSAARPQLQKLDTGSVDAFPIPGFALCAGGDDRATIAWTAVRADRSPGYVMTTDSSARFGGRQQISADQEIGGLACTPDGSVAVTYGTPSHDQPEQAKLFARVRRAGESAFAEPERIPVDAASLEAPFVQGLSVDGNTVGQDLADAAIPAPAFDPHTGGFAVAYVAAPAASRRGRVVIVRRALP